MKFLNFLLFPFKLIFYILHIFFLDIIYSLKFGFIPIFENFYRYPECWKQTKNIDSFYKKLKYEFIEELTKKPEDSPFRINCDTFVHKKFLWWTTKFR